MKKLLSATVATLVIASGTMSIATAAGSNEHLVRMLAQNHDLTGYQQELMEELITSGKLLAKEVKKPKVQVKEFLIDLGAQDSMDVEQIMSAYREWQRGVEQQFERTLNIAASLHSQLSEEQRGKLINTIRKISSRN
ncbi:MAG: hypothetical protein R6W80_10655 [Haliea sp.]